MFNPYSLQALANAREEDIQRALARKNTYRYESGLAVRRRPSRPKHLKPRPRLFGRRPSRRPLAPVRVVNAPLEPSALGGQASTSVRCN